jgi:hypothetical protein
MLSAAYLLVVKLHKGCLHLLNESRRPGVIALLAGLESGSKRPLSLDTRQKDAQLGTRHQL